MKCPNAHCGQEMKELFLSTYCPQCEFGSGSKDQYPGYIAFNEGERADVLSRGGVYREFVFRAPEMAEWFRLYQYMPTLPIRKVYSLTPFDWSRGGKSLVCDSRRQCEVATSSPLGGKVWLGKADER